MNTPESEPIGKKYDGGKPRYGLLPPQALKDVVKVLTMGAIKYGDDNWKMVKDGNKRYFDAMMRHSWQWKEDPESKDEDSGISHLAHAICCALFLLEKEYIGTKDETEKTITKEDGTN